MNSEKCDIEKEVDEIAYGLSNFKALGNNQLSFIKGDEIRIVEKSSEHWWWAEQNGNFGYVPVNHIIVQSSTAEYFWQDDEYFGQYGCLKLHHEMLSDEPRNMAYLAAIQKNAEYIKDKGHWKGSNDLYVYSTVPKIVLDIGCGTGILSMMMAKHGKPRKVYAVEASEMAAHADLVVKHNGFGDVINVIHGYVEDVELEDKVDIIVSEWMGTVLLFEMMVEAVILARNKLLKDDGIVWPSSASLFLVPCSAHSAYSSKYEFWNSQYGFDLTPLKTMAKSEFLDRPFHNHVMNKEDCLSQENSLFTLDIKTVSVSDLEEICANFNFVINKSGTFHGFACWFEVRFQNLHENGDDVILNTGPKYPHETSNISCITKGLTHWKHNLFLLDSPLTVECDDVIQGSFNLYRNKEWRRHLFVTLKFDLKRKDEIMNSIDKQFRIWRPANDKEEDS